LRRRALKKLLRKKSFQKLSIKQKAGCVYVYLEIVGDMMQWFLCRKITVSMNYHEMKKTTNQ
jgi:hypothetical protein